jgi:hypothetical protein
MIVVRCISTSRALVVMAASVRCAKTHMAKGLFWPCLLARRHLASRNVAAAAGVGFMREIGKLYHRVGWGLKGDDLPCPSTPTARLARGRQRHHSKSGGAGRLWSKDQAPSRLNNRRRRPMRKKLVGAANRPRCVAGVHRAPNSTQHSAVP